MKRLVVVALVWTVAACAHQELVPAPEAETVQGKPSAAEQAVAGVTVIVDGQAWPGPASVSDYVTPVKVTLRNDGEHPLRVRYQDFELRGESGVVLSALTPYRVAREANLTVAPITPAYPWSGYALAPWYGAYYPGFPLWSDDFAFDPDWDWYDQAYGYWPAQRPSQSILQQALPEGVLKPGGAVTGFIYFRGLGQLGPELHFQAQLVDARTKQTFGTVDIPFEVTGKGGEAEPSS